MPRHAFENAKTQGGDATITDANEWNADHTPITSTCAAVHTPGTAVPLTVTSGASAQVLYVERCDISTDGDNDADIATVANGALLGQTIDLICISVGASTTNTLTISATFTGGSGTTTYVLPWSGTTLVNTGMRIIWDGAGWVIDKIYAEYPHACIDFLQPLTTDPPIKLGMLQIYSKVIGGRAMPKWIGSSGVDTPFQPFLGMNSIKICQVGTATALAFFGTTCTITGTATAQAVVGDGTVKGKMRYSVIPTTTTAANAAGVFCPQSEAHGAGGYYFVTRFAMGVVGVTQRIFVGMMSGTTLVANTEFKTTTTATVGLCTTLATSAGNWFLCAADGTTAMTAIDLGATNFAVSSTSVVELVLFCPPNSTAIQYRVTNMVTGVSVSGTYTGNCPPVTTLLAPQINTNNNATAAACSIAVNKWYLESDY